MKNTLGEKLWVKGLIKSWIGVPTSKILFCEHHRSHAAAAFLTAPTRDAAILTADGVGEWATLSVGRGKREPGGKTEVELLREIRFPHSLGMLYSTFTAFLGFQVNEGEYKVMGLASYGQPRFANEVRKIVQRTSDGRLLFHTITLNGKTATLNRYDTPTPRNWYGVTINYQQDGGKTKTPYSVYLDKLTFTARE